MEENKKAVKQGGSVAKRIIKNFEKTTGKKVVSDENYLYKVTGQTESPLI